MSKSKIKYVCSLCGYESAKWYGKCPSCSEWNTLEEQTQTLISNKKDSKNIVITDVDITPISSVEYDDSKRISTGLKELDRVLGGGLVSGSIVLVGGDPGIGKSTLLLQICQKLGLDNKIFYVSGEESKSQIKIRANRLCVTTDNLMLISSTDIDSVINSCIVNKPDILIIDSIQTMMSAEINSTPGSATQIKDCTSKLVRLAKSYGISTFIIGHVTKEGSLAGPKILEHMVDTVLYFEGEKNLSHRVLRAVKNRFGSTNEIGVFDMAGNGLVEIDNPSKMFLNGRPENVPGSCVTCVMEGTRPILTEIQALVTKTGYPVPRRMASGIDYNRMSLLVAVLEKRANMPLFNQDAFINVVGGFKVIEPSADISICLSLASSFSEFEIPSNLIAIGEVGLSGEVRAVSFIDKRISEAKRLGFNKIMVPARNKITANTDGIEIIKIKSISQAIYLVKNDIK